MDEIVVVANKVERSIREVAATVTVVDRGDLQLELADSVQDVLRYTPGIDYESSGSRFGAEGINIRGIGGNRVAILIDGVPMNDQFDVGSFSNATRGFINAGFVRRMEVLHGPASALYGSAAIGGVVALATPSARDLTDSDGMHAEVTAVYRGASDGVRGNGLIALQGDRFGFVTGFAAANAAELDPAAVDRNVDRQQSRRRSALARLSFEDPLGNTLEAAYYRQDADVQSSLRSMLGTGRFRSTTGLDGDDRHESDLMRFEYRFGRPGGVFDNGVVRLYRQKVGIVQDTRDERREARTPVVINRLFSFEQTTSGIEFNLGRSLEVGTVAHQLGLGLEYRHRRTEEFRDGEQTNLADGTQTKTILGETFPLRDFPLSKSREWGAYLEDAVSFGPLTLIASVRADSYDLGADNDPVYAEDYPFAAPVPVDASRVTPKLGVVYEVSAEMDAYLQYSQGFRAPPYQDVNIGLELPLFNVRAIPNADLRSERSAGWDAGFRFHGDAVTARLALFRTDYKDFIESRVRVGVDPVSGRNLFQSQNIRRARIEGIEAGVSVPLGRSESTSVEASYYTARGENLITGEALNSLGPSQAVVSANWNPLQQPWSVRLQATMTSSWNDRDQSRGELFKPDGYSVVDLFVARRLGDNLVVRFAAENLTDKTYWSWSDVRSFAPDDPVLPYLSRPGRNVSVGIDLIW